MIGEEEGAKGTSQQTRSTCHSNRWHGSFRPAEEDWGGAGGQIEECETYVCTRCRSRNAWGVVSHNNPFHHQHHPNTHGPSPFGPPSRQHERGSSTEFPPIKKSASFFVARRSWGVQTSTVVTKARGESWNVELGWRQPCCDAVGLARYNGNCALLPANIHCYSPKKMLVVLPGASTVMC